jgi:hypothetical protein
MSMPRFLKRRASSFEISSSSTGTTRGRNSTRVTSVPKLRKMEANSTPTAPAPMTMRDLGRLGNGENLDVGQDAVVRGETEDCFSFGAGGEDDVFGFDLAGLAVGAGHINGVNAVNGRAGKAAVAGEDGDPVCFFIRNSRPLTCLVTMASPCA